MLVALLMTVHATLHISSKCEGTIGRGCSPRCLLAERCVCMPKGGDAVKTRRSWSPLIAVLVSAVALALLSEAALPGDENLEYTPVQGRVSPHGSFVGNLTIVAFNEGEAGELWLTGVLNGTATQSAGAKTQVTQQTFTAPATQLDAHRTTDVLLLKIAPITLSAVGWQITLEPVTLDIDALPDEGNLLAKLLREK
jgi:hypothetical protein